MAVEWVAGSLWNQWPDERGMGGRITVESVAGWAWNGWPDHRGMPGRMGVEYTDFSLNTGVVTFY